MNKFAAWLKQKNRLVYLIYSALALFILLPLLKPGFIFAMDMVFAPHIKLPAQPDLLNVVLYFLNFVLPSSVIQKIIMFLAIFLAGLGAHRLISSRSIWPQYFAGIFYIFNPFVYSRFMYGHLYIFLAYAIFPWGVKAIFDFFQDMKWKSFAKLCGWLLAMTIVSLHGLALFILFFAIALIFYIFRERKNRRKILEVIILCSLAVSLSITCLALSKLGDPGVAQSITTFNENDLQVFKTTGDEKLGLPVNVLALYGFWGDEQGQFIDQKVLTPWWPALAVVILVLVGWGIFVGFKAKQNNQRWITGIFLTTGIVSFVLALGIAWQPLAPLNQFLYDHVPFYYGFREPQKFVALICLAYAFLAALGVQDILLKVKRAQKKVLYGIVVGFLIVLPMLYSPGLSWGFWGQLRAVDYPQEWYEVNDILNQDEKNFKVLFLPWHQYMYFDFTGRVIANPAPRFFDKEVIAGDNMQLGGIETQSTRPESKYIEELLRKRNLIRDVGQKLAPLEVKYVVLAKEIDYVYYTKAFLDRQDDLEVVYEKESLKIYLNKAIND